MSSKLKKNVFIIGAGASKEFGLPTGEELKSKISQVLNVSQSSSGGRPETKEQRLIRQAISCLVVDQSIPAIANYDQLLEQASRIRKNMPLAPSIDNFLDTHRDKQGLVAIGKLAIAHVISQAERKSLLFFEPSNNRSNFDFNKVKDTWLGKLFKILVSQRTFSQFLVALKRNVFISFNYDRCVQQFFCHCSKSYFALDDNGVEEVLKHLQIKYVYGTIGEFSWEQYSRSNFGCEEYSQTNFGTGLLGDSLCAASRNIRTFTEGSNFVIVNEFMELFKSVNNLSFLGFGFLPLNMKALFDKVEPNAQRIMATSYGQSPTSSAEIKREIALTYATWRPEGVPTMVVNKTCSEFMDEFHRLF